MTRTLGATSRRRLDLLLFLGPATILLDHRTHGSATRNANSAAAFKGVVRKANEKGVVVVSFDNVIDSPDQISVNVNQLGLGEMAATFLLKEAKKTGDLTFLHVRGPSGQPVDLARDKGFHEVLDKSGAQIALLDLEASIEQLPGLYDRLPHTPPGMIARPSVSL